MKSSAFKISSVVATILVASSAFGAMTLTASNIAGIGVYLQTPTVWTIQFSFDGDLNQTSLNGKFGNWTLTVTGTDGTNWTKSSNETEGGSFTNIANGKIFSVELGNSGISTGSIIPTLTILS